MELRHSLDTEEGRRKKCRDRRGRLKREVRKRQQLLFRIRSFRVLEKGIYSRFNHNLRINIDKRLRFDLGFIFKMDG